MKQLLTNLFLLISISTSGQAAIDYENLPIDSNKKVIIFAEDYIDVGAYAFYSFDNFDTAISFSKSFYKSLIEEHGVTSFNFYVPHCFQFMVEQFLKGQPYFLFNKQNRSYVDLFENDIILWSDIFVEKLRILRPYYLNKQISINCIKTNYYSAAPKVGRQIYDILTYKHRLLNHELLENIRPLFINRDSNFFKPNSANTNYNEFMSKLEFFSGDILKDDGKVDVYGWNYRKSKKVLTFLNKKLKEDATFKEMIKLLVGKDYRLLETTLKNYITGEKGGRKYHEQEAKDIERTIRNHPDEKIFIDGNFWIFPEFYNCFNVKYKTAYQAFTESDTILNNIQLIAMDYAGELYNKWAKCKGTDSLKLDSNNLFFYKLEENLKLPITLFLNKKKEKYNIVTYMKSPYYRIAGHDLILYRPE